MPSSLMAFVGGSAPATEENRFFAVWCGRHARSSDRPEDGAVLASVKPTARGPSGAAAGATAPGGSRCGLTENVAHQFATAFADGFVHKHPYLWQELFGSGVKRGSGYWR
jgi:hypothetical protein